MWGDSLVRNQYKSIHPVDAEIKFYKCRFPILRFSGVLKATLITPCFILLTSILIDEINVNSSTLRIIFA